MISYSSDHATVDVRYGYDHDAEQSTDEIREIYWYSERHDFKIYLSKAPLQHSNYNVGYGDFARSHHDAERIISDEKYEAETIAGFESAMEWCTERLVMAITMGEVVS